MTPTAAPEGACPSRTAPPWPRASPRRLRPDRSSGSKSNERSGSTGASIQVRNRDLGAVGTGRAVTLRLAGEVNDQHQERDHASDEADGPDKFLQERLISVNGIVAVERLRVHSASARRSVEPRDDVPGEEGKDGKDDDDDRAVLDRCVSGETGRLGFRAVRVFVAHGSSLTALRGRHACTRPVRTTTLQESEIGRKT